MTPFIVLGAIVGAAGIGFAAMFLFALGKAARAGDEVFERHDAEKRGEALVVRAHGGAWRN
jgi:hypothetical protein